MRGVPCGDEGLLRGVQGRRGGVVSVGGVRGFDDDATWPNDKGFLGATKDPTGLTHLSAREYDPDTGRFISVDPVLDTADPLQMNGYTYASNNPVTHSDPSGLRVDGCQVNHDCGGTKKNAPKGSQRCTVYCGPVTFRNGAKPSGDPIGRHALGRPLSEKEYGHLLNLGYRGSQDFTFRDAIAYLGTGLDDNQWDGFCRTVNSNAQSLCRHNPFTGNDTTDFGLKQALVVGGITTVVAAGIILCVAGGCESGAFQAAGLACTRSSLCLRAVSGAMTAGGAINSGYGAGELPAGSWLGRLACRSSFVPGTQVLMADGSKKDIEDVRVGDKVLATDPETGETTTEPVLGTITSKGDKNLVQITIDTDAPLRLRVTGDEPKSGASNLLSLKSPRSGLVIATDNHPFWVAGDINAWVEAIDVKPGMWLRTSAGAYVQVTTAKHWTIRRQRVHNLTVASLNTYYVLSSGQSILVHNVPCQIHHFATNKSRKYTPHMAAIANKYGLDLDGSWNKMSLPHQGRHASKYHDFVLAMMQRADREAGGDAQIFLKKFDVYVKIPVINNPDFLYRKGGGI